MDHDDEPEDTKAERDLDHHAEWCKDNPIERALEETVQTGRYFTTRTCWRCRGVGSIDAGGHGAECPTCKGGGHLRDRITTIADEANGPHPVQSADESLTCIEAALTSERLGRLAAEAELTRLRAVVRALLECHEDAERGDPVTDRRWNNSLEAARAALEGT